jgi:uncharacterized membrane protein YccC
MFCLKPGTVMAEVRASVLSRWSWPEGAFALRMVLAVLAAYTVAELSGLGHGYSAALSALIVIRPYQQGAVKAGLVRLLATMIGMVMAFGAVLLRRTGLNDYALLSLALVPLSLIAAYDASYRTAMISALLILSAPFARLPEIDVAVARTLVVGLGAVMGVAVSLWVLPRSHVHAIAEKTVRIVRGLMTQLGASLNPTADFRKTEKEDARLRRDLMELGRMAKETRGRSEDDGTRLIGLTRHIQATALLLRSQWRRADFDETARAGRQRVVTALDDLSGALVRGEDVQEKTKGVFAAIKALPEVPENGEGGIEKWLLATLARNLVAMASLSNPKREAI